MGDIDAQISISDSFNNPRWGNTYSGDTNLFIRSNYLLSSNSNNLLKHSYKLDFRILPAKEIELKCNVLSNINLSSSNYIEIGLLDSNSIQTFIRIGNTQDQSQFFVNDSMVFVGMEKEFDVTKFNYNLKIVYSNGNFQFILKNELNHITRKFNFNSPNSHFQWIGGYIKILQYGSSAIAKHGFQNLYIGPIQKDTTPPKLIHCKQIDNYKLEFKFNEKIQNLPKNKIAMNCFTIEKLATTIDSSTIILQITNNLRQSCDTLKIRFTDVFDVENNVLKGIDIKLNYVFIDTPYFGEILLTEFMTKPTPSLGILPEKKYIEIFNNSNKLFNLNCLLLSDQIGQCYLPNYILKPKEILLLVSSSDTNDFKNYHIKGIPSFPSFNQDEDYIILKTIANTIIFQLYYNEYMQHWQFRNGGYSFEKMDIKHGTFETNNWTSNTQNGGTPGQLISTSANVPHEIKIIESYFTQDSIFIRVNQTLDPNLDYQIKTATLLIDVRLKKPEILIGKLPSILMNCHKIELLELLVGDSSILTHQLPILSFKENFEGTNLDFNELLYHNFVGNPDFLELTNNDSLAIFFNQFVLTVKEENGIAIKEQIPLKNKERWLINPGENLAFTVDKCRIIEQYPEGNLEKIIHLKGFPNFNSEKGTLELTHLTQWTKTVSTFNYSNYLHSPLYTETTGISLEKLNEKLKSDMLSSWGSATANQHFGTPGNVNSIYFSGGTMTENKFQLRNQKISVTPTEIDPLVLDFNFSQPGYIVNASIIRKDGTLIEHCIQNARMGASGSISIRPVYKDNPLPTENYILKLEAFLPNADICNQIIRFSVINPTTN